MAVGTLAFLTYLGIILLLGIICTLISRWIRIPNLLLLVLVGIGLSRIEYKGAPLISFSPIFLVSVGILALVMIVFDSTSRLKLRTFDTFSISALKLTIFFLVLNLTALTLATHLIFAVPIPMALLFASIMSGTAPGVVLSIIKETKNKVLELLEIESIINTPIIVIIPFIIIDFIQNVKEVTLNAELLISQLIPFLTKIVAGIGAGILIGLIVFKVMRRKYSEQLSPLAIIVSALLTYVLAENLGGSGVLGVTTIGLFFGNVYVKEKKKLAEFSAMFSNALEILVFVLVGLVIVIPFTASFLLKSASLFLILLFLRFIAIEISLSGYNFKEKLFMTLNAPKGIAVAVVVFLLATIAFTGMAEITNLILAILLYSIVLSSLVAKFSKFFIRTEIVKKEG